MTVKETCQSYKWSHLRNRGSKIQNILPTRDLVKIVFFLVLLLLG